jgi:hypothetical protein
MRWIGRKLLICSVAFTLCFSAALSAQDTSGTAADSVPADTSTAAAPPEDSTAVSPVAADSAAALGSQADTTAAESSADSLKGSTETATTPAPRRPRPSGIEVEAEVIPWDWDDYTNVIEVGLKRIQDGREYSLTKNEEYQRLFDKFQGKKVRVWARIRREGDGFYSMTINGFEPLDSLGAAATQAGPGP